MDQGATNKEVVREGEATMVKPSEETEKGFYFLSNLDQSLKMMMKTVYFYKSSPDKGDDEAVKVVRDSLAKVLVHYHPMAGKLAIGQDGRLIVKLTGDGAAFVVAHADFEIAELLAVVPPPPENLLRLVYDDYQEDNLFEIPLITVQVTKFRCGGFAVGTCMHHCLADGLSAVEFLNSWGHVARHGLPLPAPPSLDRSILKARDPPRTEFLHHEFLEIDDVSGYGALYDVEPIEYRAFVFDGAKIGRLKGKAMEEGGVIKCSTFEVLSAFVWRAWSSALRMSPHQRTKLSLAVNGRTRLNPPLPTGFFGNGIYVACAISDAEELQGEPLSGGVKRVQNALGMVTNEYMRSAIDYLEMTRRARSPTATLGISAWSKLSFHSIDFGWGEPVYSGPVGLPRKDVMLFLSHGEDRKDISVYLGFPRSAMDTFERLVNEI